MMQTSPQSNNKCLLHANLLQLKGQLKLKGVFSTIEIFGVVHIIQTLCSLIFLQTVMQFIRVLEGFV